MAFYFFSLSSPCLVTQNCFTQYSIIQKWKIRCSNFLSLLVALEVEPCGPCSMLTYVQIQGSDDAQHLSAHMHACTHTCKAFGKTLGAATKAFDVRKVIKHAFGIRRRCVGIGVGIPFGY